MIYLYTGEGAGKTTSALGMALRSLGHGYKVIMIQFMKGRKDIGEYKFQKYNKNYKVYQFGRPRFIKNLKSPPENDIKNAERGLEFVLDAIKQKPRLLILDEINIATAYNLLDADKVIKTIKRIPKSMDIVMTGRYAPKKLVDIADYVNEVKMHKMPKIRIAKKGINY
jgi:cob(I)alamin adenosyltransferase